LLSNNISTCAHSFVGISTHSFVVFQHLDHFVHSFFHCPQAHHPLLAFFTRAHQEHHQQTQAVHSSTSLIQTKTTTTATMKFLSLSLLALTLAPFISTAAAAGEGKLGFALGNQ